MASNKVYSGTWHVAVGAAGTETINFNVQSVGREIKILSLTYLLRIFNAAFTVQYDWQTFPGQNTLTVANDPTNRICHSFNAPSVAPAFMGSYIEIFEPGHFHFDGFFVANNLPLNLFFYNGDIDQRDFYTTVIIETEEKTMFSR